MAATNTTTAFTLRVEEHSHAVQAVETWSSPDAPKSDLQP